MRHLELQKDLSLKSNALRMHSYANYESVAIEILDAGIRLFEILRFSNIRLKFCRLRSLKSCGSKSVD
jgi:hypothetical protein